MLFLILLQFCEGTKFKVLISFSSTVIKLYNVQM